MKDKKKWLDFVHKHFAGMGIGAVTVAMALTVARGASGQGAGFDPGDIDTSFSSGLSDLPDKTGYDLSGEGEGNEEVNHNAGGDQEEEKEEEPEEEPEEEESQEEAEALGLNPEPAWKDPESEQVILPEGMADEAEPSDTIDATINPGPGEGNILEAGPGKGVVFIVKFFLFPADNHRNLIPARRHARIPAGGRRAVFLRPLWLLPFPWFSSVSCVALPVSHGRLAPLFPARLSTFVTFWGGIPFGVLPLARAARGSSAPEAAFLAGAGLDRKSVV